MTNIIFVALKIIIGVFVVVTLLKNYVFLLLAPFYPVKEAKRLLRALSRRDAAELAAYNPKVSVIVPAWNEAVGIVKTINSIVHNGYDNFELVVVNDGSTDRTNFVVSNHYEQLITERPELKPKLIYIAKRNGGKGAALNAGIQNSTGDIILTVDADSFLTKSSLSRLVRYYLDKAIMCVVGNVEVLNSSNVVGLAQRLEYYFGFYNKRGHAVLGAEYIFGGACASFRREVFDKLGLFDTENKTEDIEMSMRTCAAGYRSTYAEDVICYTEGATDVASLLAQRVRWKKGRLDTFRKYRQLFFSTEDHHNVYLSFLVLPFSLMSEVQLCFEPIAISILVVYSVVTSEYLSLTIGILFIFITYLAAALFAEHNRRVWLILTFPFTWTMFYFLDWIEFIALYKSIKLIRQKRDISWQKWQRQGLKVKI